MHNDEIDAAKEYLWRKRARQSYEAGLGVLKAGITFGELVRVMEEPLRAAGCWALTPLVHTVNPQAFVGLTGVNRDSAPSLPPAAPRPSSGPPPPMAGTDVVLPPGTSLAFEPNACSGRTRVNIGGTVIVTEDGYRETNKLPCQMRVKAA